jgi:hypothetical protein
MKHQWLLTLLYCPFDSHLLTKSHILQPTKLVLPPYYRPFVSHHIADLYSLLPTKLSVPSCYWPFNSHYTTKSQSSTNKSDGTTIILATCLPLHNKIAQAPTNKSGHITNGFASAECERFHIIQLYIVLEWL